MFLSYEVSALEQCGFVKPAPKGTRGLENESFSGKDHKNILTDLLRSPPVARATQSGAENHPDMLFYKGGEGHFAVFFSVLPQQVFLACPI